MDDTAVKSSLGAGAAGPAEKIKLRRRYPTIARWIQRLAKPHPGREKESVGRMTTMSVNVFEYFHRALGVAPRDPTLRQLPLISPCGADCKAVIDAASAYLKIADPHPSVRRPVFESVNAAVEILWRG